MREICFAASAAFSAIVGASSGSAATITSGQVFLSGQYLTVGGNGAGGSIDIDADTLTLAGPNFPSIIAGPAGSTEATVTIQNGSNFTITATDDSVAFITVGEDDNSGTVPSLVVDDSILTLTATEGSNGATSIDIGIDYAGVPGEGGTGEALFTGSGTVVTLAPDGDTGFGDGINYVSVGTRGTSSGTLRVEDEASLVIGGYLAVAGRPEGITTVTSDTSQATGLVEIFSGASVEANGVSTFNGSTSEFSIQIGSANPDPAGGSSGTVIVGDATLATPDTASLYSESNIWVGARPGSAGTTSGTLIVQNGGTVSCGSGSLHVGAGGTLGGDAGNISCTTIVEDGGTLAPGASPGTLNILDDLILREGSMLDYEIGLLAQDFINITGDLFIEGAFDLNISFLDGALPDSGSIFDFLVASNFDNGLAETFATSANINLFGVGSATEVSLFADGGSLRLQIVEISPVPLPASSMLLLAAVGALVGLRRRERNLRQSV